MNIPKSDMQSYFSKLLVLMLVLVGSGLVLSFSISYSFSLQQGREVGIASPRSMSVFGLFFKQVVASFIGLVAVFYLLRTPTKFIRKMSDFLAIIAAIAMIYTTVAGPEINGSRRWLVIAGISIQTGDFARIILILYLANIFTSYHRGLLLDSQNSRSNIITRNLFVRFFLAMIIYIGTLYFQKDYSSLLISSAVIMSMVLVSDMPQSWKIGSFLLAVMFIVVIIMSNPMRMQRIITYLQPGGDPLGAGFQIKKSYEIIGNGGLLGSGVGSNMLAILSLPYFNNDFVFSIIVGEYGLIGALVIIFFFWMLCFYAFKLSKHIYVVDRYYYFLLLAGTVNLLISVVAHIAVTIGIVPTTGLNLPFYSSGGSSMITSILSYGLILRSARALQFYEKRERYPATEETRHMNFETINN